MRRLQQRTLVPCCVLAGALPLLATLQPACADPAPNDSVSIALTPPRPLLNTSAPLTATASTATASTATAPASMVSALNSRDEAGSSFDRFISGKGTGLFLAAGTLLPLAQDGEQGREYSLRVADAALTSAAITYSLKSLIHSRRPDGSGDDSFPSQHATVAFAVATMQSKFHPQQAAFWYLGASLIAASRVRMKRHRVGDVLAGAGIGYLTARYELKSRRGFILSPFIHPHREGGGGGLALAGDF